MFKKTFSFCTMCIQLQSETKIEDSHFFYKFLSNDTPDVTIRIVNGAIPERRGRLLFESRTLHYYSYQDKEYRFTSYFIGKTNSYKDYAVRIIDGDNITLILDYADGMWDSMVFGALGLPELLLKSDIFITHSSFIIHNGKAILFSANKLVGKSTQAALWEKYRRAQIINGDRAAIYFDENNTAYACSIPYCGSSKVCVNAEAPIEAIVLLNQAEGNFIEQVDPFTAFKELIGKTTYNEWDIDQLEKAVNNIQRLVENVPVYKLYCLPDEGAVITLESKLKAEKRT